MKGDETPVERARAALDNIAQTLVEMQEAAKQGKGAAEQLRKLFTQASRGLTEAHDCLDEIEDDNKE